MAGASLSVTTPITADLLHGAPELEFTGAGVRVHRLPEWARRQASDSQLEMVESQPAGVRLVFRTAATRVELCATAWRFGYGGAPERPKGVFDLVVDGNLSGQKSLDTATIVTIDMATGNRDTAPGGVDSVVFEGLAEGPKQIELWLPHNESIELVSLRTDAPVEAVAESGPRWLHHGSSISQGSNASHPTGTWPAVAAARQGLNLVNLGFGGSAMLDPFVARIMRDAPADLVSLELGINLVNADLMRLRAFRPAVHGYLDMIREGHPDTPLLIISPLYCPIHEQTPGPGAFDTDALAKGEMRFRATGSAQAVAAGKLTLEVIREQLSAIVAERSADDENLHYLDGRDLFGPVDERELPLADALHPGTAAHHRMGTRFAQVAAQLLPAPLI